MAEQRNDRERVARWCWLIGTGSVVALTAVIVIWLCINKSAPPESITAQWNKSIARLGFEPIYPPLEDFMVGDLLAMITTDSSEDVIGEPFAGRSIKLAHLDLSAELQKHYQETYQFPETAARPAADKLWPQTPAAESVFKPPATRNTLPLVVFPSFTITRATRGSASASGGTGLWDLAFGSSADSNETVEVKIGAAETYGVPALPAEERLFAFCKDPKTQLYCSDKAVRQQLSMVVGSRIYDRIVDKKTRKESPRFAVELALVNRAFLVRSFETRILHDSKSDATLGATTKDASGNKATVGASGSVRDSHSVIVPDTPLARPVAIGFKSVRWLPKGGSE